MTVLILLACAKSTAERTCLVDTCHLYGKQHGHEDGYSEHSTESPTPRGEPELRSERVHLGRSPQDEYGRDEGHGERHRSRNHLDVVVSHEILARRSLFPAVKQTCDGGQKRSVRPRPVSKIHACNWLRKESKVHGQTDAKCTEDFKKLDFMRANAAKRAGDTFSNQLLKEGR